MIKESSYSFEDKIRLRFKDKVSDSFQGERVIRLKNEKEAK